MNTLLRDKIIKKKDGRATILMHFTHLVGQDKYDTSTILVSATGRIGILASSNLETLDWEYMLEAVYTAVDEVLILNS